MIASPAYHGTISGLVKNALDHAEELRGDVRPYFTGRAVGCLTVGQGWQGAVSTLAALRSTVHALRGWPTPLGVVVNSAAAGFGPDGRCDDPQVQRQLEIMGGQVVEFARMHRLAASAAGRDKTGGQAAGREKAGCADGVGSAHAVRQGRPR